MPTNRASIIAHFSTTLAGITIGNGFGTNVVTVDQHFRDWTKYTAAELAALNVYPAPEGTPDPIRWPFQQYEEFLDMIVIGHVPINFADPDYDTLRTVALSQLGVDIEDALFADPMRDLWAIDTEKVAPLATDEGMIAKVGADVQVASLVLRFRCTYYPND